MRNKCCEYEEAIWEHAHSGAALSEDVRRHIEECPGCANAVREAGQLSRIMLVSDRVPPVPDCRSAVMARISGTRRSAGFGWAYACAAVLVAAVASAYVIRPNLPVGFPANKFTATKTQSRPSPTQIARVPSEVSHHENTKERKSEIGNSREKYRAQGIGHRRDVPVYAAGTTSGTKSSTSNEAKFPQHARIALNRTRPPKASCPAPVQIAKLLPAPIAKLKADIAGTVSADTSATIGAALAVPQPPTPSPQPPSDDTRPVAIAVVTWPSGDNQPQDSYSYSYTERDSETGETTKCSVNRSGNSIEIYMEVKPDIKKDPVRGSVDYETKVNA